MLIDLHVIQNIAPANLNRDDTGSPKDAIFGGYRRARVSSQAWKRAIRTAFKEDMSLSDDRLALRTKRVVGEVAERLGRMGRDTAQSSTVADALLTAGGFATVPDPRTNEPLTEYLFFIGRDEIERLTTLAEQHWDILFNAAPSTETGKARKKASKTGAPELREQVLDAIGGSRAVDLALFGRMLADLPAKNVDGAVQVAHAISTHAVEFEFDYYTAVDDLNTEDETGAGMIGTVEFNSATFYRYTSIDVGDLAKNLGGDHQLAVEAALAYIRGFLLAIPSGKQSSFAAQNLPSAALAVVREHGRWSLANAFVRPVLTRTGDGLVATSIETMANHYGNLTGMYGDEGILATPFLVDPEYAKRASGFAPSGNLQRWLADIETAIGSAPSRGSANDATEGVAE